MKTSYSDLESIVYEYDSLPSTQTEAKRLALCGIQNAIVLANEQTSGKGRCGRNWESPQDGGLYVSFLITPQISSSSIHLMSFVAGIAVTNHLRSYGISATLKWPNDVIIFEESSSSDGTEKHGFRKICGILSEAAINAKEVKYCIVGMGINCKQCAISPELSHRACALDNYVDNVNKKHLMKGIAKEFFKRVADFELLGTKNLLQEYISICSTIGRSVQIDTGNEIVYGTAIGIGESGELLAETKNGIEKFSSADVYHATIVE